MGQFDKPIRILVVDADPAFRKELSSIARIGVHVGFAAAPADGSDVVVIGVENPAALTMIASFRARHSAPVIAIAGAGHLGKSLEHVLLLAELRGAALALPRPVTADELAMHAMKLANTQASGLFASDEVSSQSVARPSAARLR
jgi:hypothetical protein